MVTLRNKGAETPLLAREIAQETGIPTNYLSKVLHSLSRAGLVSSTRGRNGGFRLARPAPEITVFDIVNVFDLLSGQRRCFLGNKTCSQETACVAHNQWDHVWTVYEQFLKTTSLDRLEHTEPVKPVGRRKKEPRRRARRGSTHAA
jgi:Rrf2 family protein